MKQYPDGSLERRICETIKNKVKELDRSDLFREPVVGFSSALDAGFYELKNIIGPWQTALRLCSWRCKRHKLLRSLYERSGGRTP